jgi:hypothetical protein
VYIDLAKSPKASLELKDVGGEYAPLLSDEKGLSTITFLPSAEIWLKELFASPHKIEEEEYKVSFSIFYSS